MLKGGQFATIPLENPLWQHASQFYSQPGMESVLLLLQDQHQADINQILQAIWLADSGRVWKPACVTSEYLNWSAEYIRPLRHMRRRMKEEWGDLAESVRQKIKATELEAEQYGLALLMMSGEKGSYVTDEKTDSLILRRENLIALADYSGLLFPEEATEKIINA